MATRKAPSSGTRSSSARRSTNAAADSAEVTDAAAVHPPAAASELERGPRPIWEGGQTRAEFVAALEAWEAAGS